MLKFMVPVVGWYLLARDRRPSAAWTTSRSSRSTTSGCTRSGPGPAVEPGRGPSKPEVLESWDLAEIEFLGVDEAGTDHRIEFRDRDGGREYRFFCSSLRTNPWASEVVRRLGRRRAGADRQPPETLDR